MTVEALCELAVNNPANEHIMLDLEVVGDELAAKILAATGVDVAGFVISVDNYGIRHAMERHGDGQTEGGRNQVALQVSDFNIAIEIVQSAANMRYDFRGKLGHPNLRESIVFDEKISGNQYFVSMEVRQVRKRGKTNRLVFQTMYIKKSAVS